MKNKSIGWKTLVFSYFLVLNLSGTFSCLSQCRHPYIVQPDTAYQKLSENLHNYIFGQHIAVDAVINSLWNHAKEEFSRKALVLSFHGWTGSGKTFVAEQIIKSFYDHGAEKHFVKFYFGPHDFPDHRPEFTEKYRKQLRDEVKKIVSSCERAVFVFDEAHKIPQGVLDALVPYLEPAGRNFEGINYRKAIFIFLSNVGANTINQITFNHWNSTPPKKRSQLTFHDYELQLQNEAYRSDKENPGFLKSRILEKALIDIFIPFLPMEKEHVIQCAEVEIKRVGALVSARFIAEKLAYWPDVEAIYSRTGCKQIDGLVKKYHTFDTRKRRNTDKAEKSEF